MLIFSFLDDVVKESKIPFILLLLSYLFTFFLGVLTKFLGYLDDGNVSTVGVDITKIDKVLNKKRG